jgi:hypothetical protein
VPITETAVEGLRNEYPGLAIVARRPSKFRRFMKRLVTEPGEEVMVADVVAVRATVQGIRGGGQGHSQFYELVLDVSQLNSHLPRTWVSSPSDAQIHHVNIWRATRPGGVCPWLQVSLPYLCWFTFEEAWAAAPASSRTLGSALEFAKQLLNTENHDSPAR